MGAAKVTALFRAPRGSAITASASISSAPKPHHAEPFWLKREAVLGVALVLVLVAMGILTRGRFLEAGNLRDIALNAAIPAVAAAGMTALIVAAQIDISIGATLGVCAAVVALMANRGLPAPALLFVGIGVGTLLGSVNGVLTAALKIPSIVATLATMGAIRALLILITKGDSIAVPEGISALGTGSPLGIPNLIWAAVAVCVGMSIYLSRTRLGRQHYAVGSNPRSSELSGLPVNWITFRSFALLGALVGVGGFLFVCRYTPIYPTPPKGFELEVITAVVVGGTDIFGGRGTVLGTVLAALLLAAIGVALTFLGSFMQSLRSEIQPAVQGLLILAAVLYNSLSRREAEA